MFHIVFQEFLVSLYEKNNDNKKKKKPPTNLPYFFCFWACNPKHIFFVALALYQWKEKIVGNEAKWRISKWARKQSTPNSPKNEHFLPLNIHTLCLSGGNKCSFFGKFGVLCCLETFVLGFARSPYCQRNLAKSSYF